MKYFLALAICLSTLSVTTQAKTVDPSPAKGKWVECGSVISGGDLKADTGLATKKVHLDTAAGDLERGSVTIDLDPKKKIRLDLIFFEATTSTPGLQVRLDLPSVGLELNGDLEGIDFTLHRSPYVSEITCNVTDVEPIVY